MNTIVTIAALTFSLPAVSFGRNFVSENLAVQSGEKVERLVFADEDVLLHEFAKIK